MKLSLTSRILQPIYYWRLKQALKIAEMRKQPNVIIALHEALREGTPMYLKDWRATNKEVGDAVDDLYDLMEWLRENKNYDESDRLRTIMARLARSVPDHQIEYDMSLIRDIARTYK